MGRFITVTERRASCRGRWSKGKFFCTIFAYALIKTSLLRLSKELKYVFDLEDATGSITVKWAAVCDTDWERA